MFNHAEWSKPANHLRFVKDDEKLANEEHSEEGYELSPESTLMVISTASSEQVISGQLAKIPHSSSFYRVIVLA